MNEWTSLDDAPPEGNVFLVYQPHDEGGFWFVGFLNTDGNLASMMTGDEMPAATHWATLPPRPIEDNQ